MARTARVRVGPAFRHLVALPLRPGWHRPARAYAGPTPTPEPGLTAASTPGAVTPTATSTPTSALETTPAATPTPDATPTPTLEATPTARPTSTTAVAAQAEQGARLPNAAAAS